jgi:DNA-binding transcriptional ArsR family regulator
VKEVADRGTAGARDRRVGSGSRNRRRLGGARPAVLIAERPRTTQELEPLVGLSRAGLSKSLRRLADAGLVAPRRDGYYVVYSLVPEQIQALAPAIGRYLDEPNGVASE